MDLDDINEMKKVDREGMLDVIEKFPEQIEEAIKIGKSADINFTFKGRNVVIAGMGGSAIAGEIISFLAKDECNLPIFVNKDYSLPSFVDENTLFIAISYSGNTEETLSCFSQALKRKCSIISISSGGKLEEMAKGCHIKIPQNMQPRAAIAYLLFPLIIALERLGILKKHDMRSVVKKAKTMRERIKKEVENNEAKKIAMKIKGIPVIYASDFLSPLARRWRQQINENAKMMAFNFCIPEANHNEIMAWEGKIKNFTCIFLRNKNEEKKIKKRFDFMKEVYSKKANVIEIFAEGESKLEQVVHILYLGDYVSNYLALLNEVNPTPVKLIQKLKEKIE